ncbi:GNAT family N-acetyltransferase [Naasia sp. SYSU D00948]|uniref:GNAT family N-acetyltransferase n=1 Tax=Naasia sp. SYSU D00948 TaxID=2817379 RepID=UPI001B303A66|nr:GNAT family N-acetyltransferase [Naasia sp. SYSU D00948]
MPVVRPAAPADAAALAELAALTFPLACPPGTSPEAIAQHIATTLSVASFEGYLADPGRILLVSAAPEGLAGYTMLVRGEPQDADVAAAVTVRPTIELSKVYVHPDRHGRGVAGELVAATLVRAVEEGVRSVWLGVNSENARAIRFYGKSGFAIAGPRTYFVGDQPHSDHVMVALL